MIPTVIDFFRRHIWTTVISVFVAIGSSSATYFVAVQQTRIERIEASMLAEYQAVAASKRELYAALDRFTLALSTGQVPDQQLILQMNDKMGDLRERVDLFNEGLSPDDQAKIEAVRDALANMKVEIARAKTKTDVPYVAGRQALFEAAYQDARPIVARKIGKPIELMQG